VIFSHEPATVTKLLLSPALTSFSLNDTQLTI
jgi:hypothetical protein